MHGHQVLTFFHGSYMNLEVLNEVGIAPELWEVARLSGYDVSIAPRANLVCSDQHCVFGIVATATHEELARLYAHAEEILGETYLPEAVLVETLEGKWLPALCYLCYDMKPRPAASDYVNRILTPAREYGFPEWYVARLQSFLMETG